jgi:hypothetical protein
MKQWLGHIEIGFIERRFYVFWSGFAGRAGLLMLASALET